MSPDPPPTAAPDWRQGDVFTNGLAGVFGHADSPLTPAVQAAAAAAAEPGGVVLAQVALPRFVVISQTCDLVRQPTGRPYVQIAAVVDRDDPGSLKGDQPRFVPLPWAGERACVDLDVVAVLEKPLYARIADSQTPSRPTHIEGRRFANAVGRYYSRFAFPDDVASALQPLAALFKDKHGRPASPVQPALLKVAQIRATTAGENWDDACLDVILRFIVSSESLPPFDPDEATATPLLVEWLNERDRADVAIVERLATTSTPADQQLLWNELVRRWAERCSPGGQVVSITAEAHSDADFPASELWRSERVDLDHLSSSADLSTVEE